MGMSRVHGVIPVIFKVYMTFQNKLYILYYQTSHKLRCLKNELGSAFMIVCTIHVTIDEVRTLCTFYTSFAGNVHFQLSGILSLLCSFLKGFTKHRPSRWSTGVVSFSPENKSMQTNLGGIRSVFLTEASNFGCTNPEVCQKAPPVTVDLFTDGIEVCIGQNPFQSYTKRTKSKYDYVYHNKTGPWQHNLQNS